MRLWSNDELLYVIIILLHKIVRGHVSLTFPPARYPALDFRDSVRTKAPCGVDKSPNGREIVSFSLFFTYTSAGRVTILVAGETYNVTWSMSYLHPGGFKLYLLNREGQPLRQLTSQPVGTAFVAAYSPMCVL